MAIAQLKELIEAGVHFGSSTSRWNPQMKPYVHSKNKNIYIIDLKETLRGLIRSYHFLTQLAAKGQKVLFVGTKRQCADIVRQEAQRCGSYFVAGRWLGGTLTNMNTMRQRITRLKELEELEKGGSITQFSKKMISTLTREHKKIGRNFEGTRDMDKLPGALVVVDPSNENIAIAEAVKLNIPVVAIADTDSDPKWADFVIPGNDDSMRSVQYLLSKLADAVIAGGNKAKTQAIIDQRAGRAKGPEAAAEDKGIDVPADLSRVSSFSYGGGEEEK